MSFSISLRQATVVRSQSVENVSRCRSTKNSPRAFDELGDFPNPFLRLFLPRLGSSVVILGFRRDRSCEEGAKVGVPGINFVLPNQNPEHDRRVLMSCRS